MPKYWSVLIRSTKLVPLNWCIITKMTPTFSNNNKIIPFYLRTVRTNRIYDAHKPRGGQYLLLRTNRKRTVRGAHKTRDSCIRKMHQRFFIVINVAFEHVKLDIAKRSNRQKSCFVASSASFLFPSSPLALQSTIFCSKGLNKTLETNTIFHVNITLCCTLHYFRREDDVSHTLRHFMGTKNSSHQT